MELKLSSYEITEAIADYLEKREISTQNVECFEMSFSTTEIQRQVKKHKNGKPVMVKHADRCYPQLEEVSRKTEWHGFYEENELAIWID